MFEIHATDLFKICLREFFLLYTNGRVYSKEKRESEFIPDNRLLTFEIGNKLEDIAREKLNGFKPKAVRLKIKDVYIVGSPDIIISTGKKQYIIETKSIKKENYVSLQEPLIEHTIQLSTYLWLAKKVPSLNWEHKKGLVLYIPKQEPGYNQPVVKVFEVNLTSEMETRFKEAIGNIYKCIKYNILPRRICSKMYSSKAKQCKMAMLCFKLPEQGGKYNGPNNT